MERSYAIWHCELYLNYHVGCMASTHHYSTVHRSHNNSKHKSHTWVNWNRFTKKNRFQYSNLNAIDCPSRIRRHVIDCSGRRSRRQHADDSWHPISSVHSSTTWQQSSRPPSETVKWSTSFVVEYDVKVNAHAANGGWVVRVTGSLL